ncbi:unnamed protein product [Pedinophyceae sp. YPF-701]|nr:unnamed protein product [Pedinophyceae sp. YPF-701]
MAVFQAPPNHYGAYLAMATSAFSGAQLTVEAPDSDLKDPELRLDGVVIHGANAIAKYLALCKGPSPLLPTANAYERAQVEQWMDVALNLYSWASYWLLPHSSHATDRERAHAREILERDLREINAYLDSRTVLRVVGDGALTLADLALYAVILAMVNSTFGKDVVASMPATMKWLQAVAALPQVSGVTGKPRWREDEGWHVPEAERPKSRYAASAYGTKSRHGSPSRRSEKDGSGTAPSTLPAAVRAAQAAARAEAELQSAVSAEPSADPDKEAKKKAKLAAKAAKAAKLAEKAKKMEEVKAKQAANAGKKQAEKAAKAAKAEAEARALAELVGKIEGTPAGEKKDTAYEMPKGYNPRLVEAKWYDWWEKQGYFKPDMASDKPPFTIVIPPPNVTGALHIGHALTNSIQDTIVRWRRMCGYNALWVPGTDHAGIATQTIVEKTLMREQGVTRHDLGREKFVEKVWEWKKDYGGRILTQLRRLGSSVDWDREAFTMDANLSAAVQEAFVRLHADGLIYRDNRLVNWCCRLKTAVSDIEVDYIDVPKRTLLTVPGYDKPVEFGVLTKFAYKLEDGSGELVIATTRPETMLGDTAVAVHPEDPRYKHVQGKFLVHPVSGRKMPIICDAELVDMDFGTGAVKITPAHDPNDFATGKRHNLESINILDDEGCINAAGGIFQGQPRFVARETVVDWMKEQGLFRGTEENPMRLGLCSRSKDVIEPCLKPQWWVDCRQMAADGCAAVRSGELEIVPKEFEATWFRWLENIRDWCISRQLWWGHRIPAYYVQAEGEDHGRPGMPTEDMSRWVVAGDAEAALEKARAKYPGQAVRVVQDEDVLDTWFSSGLFPFSVFQWPSQTADLAKFYPTSLLETGHDILFFWVARMVMMGMKLTGKVPFKQVFLHSMVRDAHGRKMSKSLGNVIDPTHVIEGISLEGLHETLLTGNIDQKEIAKAKAGQKADFPDGIEECGTDALRFALVAYTGQGRDINLDIKRVVAYRYWCNKLWNALKFAMMNLGDAFVPRRDLDARRMPLACRWVLHALNKAVATTNRGMEAYSFSEATTAIYDFWQYKLCDVLIELAKPVLRGGDAQAVDDVRQALWVCLDTGLRLLHPFMPFVTEELWQRLPRMPGTQAAPSIMVADYPRADAALEDEGAERDIGAVLEVVAKFRSVRGDYDLQPKQQPRAFLVVADAARREVLAGARAEISTLAQLGSLEVLGAADAVPKGCSVTVVNDSTTAYMLLAGVLDPQKEIERLTKKQQGVSSKLQTLAKRMSEESYLKNTGEDVQTQDREKKANLEKELESLMGALKSMEELAALS